MEKALYLIVIENGFNEAVNDIFEHKAALWINAGIFTDEHLQLLKQVDIIHPVSSSRKFNQAMKKLC